MQYIPYKLNFLSKLLSNYMKYRGIEMRAKLLINLLTNELK